LFSTAPFKRGTARRRHAHLFPPPFSLAEHAEPSHPTPSTSHPRQCPCLDRSSLLAGPPLPSSQPHGELHLPGFSAQIPLRSSPPLGVRCCRSSCRPPRIAGVPLPPVNIVAPPPLRPHMSSHFLGEPPSPPSTGTLGEASWCSLVELCCRPATTEPSVSAPPHSHARELCAVPPHAPGHLLSWDGPSGQGPADLLAGCAQHATTPRGP
jgi:hypothetical protein